MNFFKKLFQKHVTIAILSPISQQPENTYYTEVTCTNCGTKLNLYIKKGIYIKYVVDNVNCTNCGCKIDREVKK